jgi:hypothetical protein
MDSKAPDLNLRRLLHAVSRPKFSANEANFWSKGCEGLRFAFVNIFGIRYTNHHWTLSDDGLPFSTTLIRSYRSQFDSLCLETAAAWSTVLVMGKR